MRVSGKWALALGLVVAPVGSARPADPEKIVPAEGAVQLMLLRQQSVQDELKLAPDQVQKIHDFADKQWEAAHKAHAAGPEAGKAKFEELGKENEVFIAKTLHRDQLKRLDQISMHVVGLLWVMDPKVSKELGLTHAQKDKIKELHEQAHKEVAAAIHSGDKGGRAAKLAELRGAQRKMLMGVLTDEQKAKWKEMAGEPFKGKLVFDEMPEKK